jgi:protein-S-isoprenylcysteine O-methyltransferase Ste14
LVSTRPKYPSVKGIAPEELNMPLLKSLLHTVLSISGFIPEHTTLIRVLFMGASILLSVMLLPNYQQIDYAVAYYTISTTVYIGFIFLVLPENGFRVKWIATQGEERAYLYYEGFLAFAFFHNGVSLSYISLSSAGTGYWGDISRPATLGVFLFLLVVGLVAKIWSAYVVGIPIYYWKDMFLGRKIGNFIVSGPYKYLDNPMYGIGLLQVYAMAVYYNSLFGLAFGAINQFLVFLFYFIVEKPFIRRTYLAPEGALQR